MTPRLVFISSSLFLNLPAVWQISTKSSQASAPLQAVYYVKFYLGLQSCHFFNEIESKPSGPSNSVYKSFRKKH